MRYFCERVKRAKKASEQVKRKNKYMHIIEKISEREPASLESDDRRRIFRANHYPTLTTLLLERASAASQ